MIVPSRRGVIAGLGAFALPLPDDPRAAITSALDAAAALPPAAGLARLAGVTAREPRGALDLATARAGLAIDARIVARFPTLRPGRGLYPVTSRAGGWTKEEPSDGDIAALRDAALVLPRPLIARTIAAIEKRPPSPARAALVAALRALEPRAPDRPGLAAQPGGDGLYVLLLQRQAGSDITPDAAAARLALEHRRLDAQADALFARIGMRGGSLGARYAALFADPRHLFADDAVGRQAAVAAMNRMLAGARIRVADQIGAVPPRCRDVAVRALSDAEIAAGKQGYRTLPAPGTPGAYIVDLREIRRRPAWSLPSVVAHELLPGHMIQLPIEAEAAPHPLRLAYAPAFAEGWAIHAEQVAARSGAFADPLAMLGHCHWLLFRVARARADLGLHRDGWSLGEAEAKLAAWLGAPAYFARFAEDAERAALEPGSRVAEAMTWLAITDRAHGLAGARLRGFHQALLVDGRRRTEAIATLGS